MTDLPTYTGFMIRRAQQAHVAAWQREVSTEISSVQFGLLSVLAQRPGVSQRELCDALDLDRSTIADLVVRLQRRGLLSRERDGDDKRRNVLQITPAGTVELEHLRPHVDDVETVLTGGLTADERAELRRLLDRVVTPGRVPVPSAANPE